MVVKKRTHSFFHNSSTIARRSLMKLHVPIHNTVMDTGTSSASSSVVKTEQAGLPLHHQQQEYPSSAATPSKTNNTPTPTSSGHHDHDDNPNNNNAQEPSSSSTGAGVLLPTWSANPQSPGDDTGTGAADNHYATTNDYRYAYANTSSRRHSPHYHHASSSGWTSYVPTLLLAVIVVAVVSMTLYSRYSLIDSMVETHLLVENGHTLQTKLHSAEQGVRRLHRQVTAYEALAHPHDHYHDNNYHPRVVDPDAHPELYAHQRAVEEMQLLDQRLKESEQKALLLKQKVQALSKREAIAKYGHQTHRVELELAFPDGREGPTKFVIELAPLDLMPHSVHFFLEMVSSGLLDGCSFILNALHVLKAAPLPYDGSSAATKARAFTRMGLESVAFKEYAPNYPHEQYTVGFAADGSPSFYINTEDNSEIHLGDPCFGTIVEGFDTVKRLEASPTRNGIWFEARIGIKKATVLT